MRPFAQGDNKDYINEKDTITDNFIMKILKYCILVLTSVLLYHCGSDNPVTNNTEENGSSTYTKILTSESGNLKFELWSATSNPNMRFGYNKIAFKVFENSSPKTTGFVKFFPWLNYTVPTPMKSTPVSAQFSYVDSLQLFTGYALFTTFTGGGATWKGTINYNNQLYSDTLDFTVISYSAAQIFYINDMQSSYHYYLSLVKPYSPVQGLNTFQCMLHRTTNDVDYEQVNNAQMYIMPWMENMGHGSSDNVHPQYKSDGIYQGVINLSMGGQWSVADTVYHNGNKITGSIPPKFIFNP
jgi:YtkA-like protein